MFEHRLAKKWKVIEVQLTQAAEFLHEPERFGLEEKDLAEYREYLRVNELGLAMEVLEDIAYEHGAKSGFWRRLKKVAETMELQDKVEEYEKAFHNALAKNV
ncbi:hypothetical protein Q4519_13780 [Motilimonas sp. 1_MG-2023]|uniref:hypothetical protein n=1 Tax=Motilimonas sp. 1_MG-2023 TaxID=3062672 RepID=UPI0026E49504|nr:hypothetical protein [Motilimonas sp. 1_MG-2023]MDO6526756.1 hypothetical protein [Motilimonas sp. 1_MG-2023]